MKKGYSVLKPLRHNGIRYNRGFFIDQKTINESHAKRLLTLRVIEPAYREDSVENQDDSLEIIPVEEESIEEILDLNFNMDELKEGAEELELKFARNISKSKLISLIVENQKMDYFLNQLED